jgi:DNA-binding NtrC family response regulator
MRDHLFALLVHGHLKPFESLKKTLWELSIETYSVATCREARDLITQCKPHVIFAEDVLPDGSWQSVLNIAEAADVPLSLIVVGSVPNTHSYLSVMDRGAFDYVAPPFEHEPLYHVVRSAGLAACRRREAAARVAVA